MILYFSGTGNSAFVARKIAKDLQDDYMNLFDRIRNKDYGEIHSDRPFIQVCPKHGWRIPHFLETWTGSRLRLRGIKKCILYLLVEVISGMEDSPKSIL